IGNYQYVIDLINSEFSTYSGKYLEFMIRDLLAESGDYNIIGTYWEKDNQNEIDIVACNQRKQHMLLIDVKLQAQKLNLDLLKYRAANFIKQYSDYQIEYKGFSLHDLDGLTGNAAL
ncbi:MAG TPA: DUF234 domain-containing protein, partial [Gammaproteobacteria bacterium]|nr:DUF234 domain-containing protein [Gammaproteobacteria bacterium]